MTVKDTNLNSTHLNKITSLYEVMKDSSDETNRIKLIDLYDKLTTEQFIVSFAGHFSAGKSSIINYLIGKDVLPNSPIPTSANIVKISSGEGTARVFFNESTTIEYDEPYDIDMIKDYAINRDAIKRIEISTAEAILPENSFILDTPGIDAADDADRLMTESSLHTVDVLYYVMDYNHVQSEVNLYFLKEIQAQGIPIYIIINQIDKHNESEITFEAFDKSVKQTFEQWKLNPQKIYYTSALSPDAAHNQIKEVKSDLFDLLDRKDRANNRITHASEQILKDHINVLEEEAEATLLDYAYTDLADFDVDTYQELREELRQLESLPTKMHDAFYDELNLTLKNAYVMPAKLRDQAGDFLESQQKDFKVGLLGSKKKTAEAKEIRLEAFLQPLLKTIESTITWKLREKFLEQLEENKLTSESLQKQVQAFDIHYDERALIALIKQGALINGNYILNYTNDVSADIKTKFRQAASNLWRIIEEQLNQDLLVEKEKLTELIAAFDQVDAFLAKEEALQGELTEKLGLLEKAVSQPSTNESVIAEIAAIITSQKLVIREAAPVEAEVGPTIEKSKGDTLSEEIASDSNQYQTSEMISIIDKTLAELNEIQAFDSILADLTSKREKLVNRELTIALFGAFSAGKSSFSNALFGEHVLPVSPNPTTAVISRISKVTDQHPHGTVIITCKDDAVLTEDLRMITKDLEPDGETFTELVDWIQRAHIHYNPALSNVYQSYLHAILKGYEAHIDLLGKTIEISLDEFESYVTDESKASYIETVDLYYDSALTRKGITLVDTPGADSVNARHTNVAFDYIKEADAILYVTYYNHAITSADRDFLRQLGRVKEAFELDKMFFIVNASDLAQSSSDLQMVLDYVENQLLEFGIRNPKIYPVSSKLSLAEKQSGEKLNEEMTRFEEKFYSFIDHDLAAITIESALWDMNRAQHLLKNFIDSANLDAAAQEQFIASLEEKSSLLIAQVGKNKTNIAKERIEERIDRQLHFVLERLFIRFHDMFTPFFNPTTITGSGKKAQAELVLNTNHFVDYVGYELLQEVRAVSLRIEAFIKDLLKESHATIQDNINEIDPSFIIPSLQEQSIESASFEQAFLTLDNKVFSQALKLFKNNKAFFEQNEREKMKDAFFEIIQAHGKVYLDDKNKVMQENYGSQWDNMVNLMEQEVINEIDQMIKNHIKMITDTIDGEVLQEKYNILKTLVE